MQCARCGYYLDPFDPSCPRCAYLARTGGGSQPHPAPYGVPGQTPSAFPIDEPGHGDRKAGLLFLCLSLGALLLVVLGLLVGPRLSGSIPGSLLVLKSGGSGGGNLLGRQAVSSDQIEQRLTRATATRGGDIEISLAWNSISDLDVQVRAPSGELVNAFNPRSACGGIQDVDANPTLMSPEEIQEGGLGGEAFGNMDAMFYASIEHGGDSGERMAQSLQELSGLTESDDKAPAIFTSKPIEHIYFARARAGTYIVFAHCYNWREHSQLPLPFTVQIRSRGKIFYETSGTLGPASFVSNKTVPIEVCRFEVK